MAGEPAVALQRCVGEAFPGRGSVAPEVNWKQFEAG